MLNSPGVIWTADDQCKMIYPGGSFCHSMQNQVCATLYCRQSVNQSSCSYTIGTLLN
jgi:hypothetical protein